jgi:serine O-acetyltransferase
VTLWIQLWVENAKLHYGLDHLEARVVLRGLLNPSLSAATLMRLTAISRGLQYAFLRRLLLRRFAIDVGKGAQFDGPILVPHPLGIVVGQGVRIGYGVTLYQNVTLGRSLSGNYAKIGDRAILYPGAVVFGSVIVETGAAIGANAVVGGNRNRV